MKKIAALLLALVMCLSVLSVAYAEETDVTVMDWAEVSATVEELGIEGEFYALEDIGLLFWVPSVMVQVEAPEDGNAYLGFFMTEDEECVFAVSVTDPAELDFDSFVAGLSEAEGVEGAEVVVINGLAAVTYTVVEDGTPVANNVSIVLDDGSVLSFVFNAGEEEWQTVSAFIAASIQPAE